MDGEAIFGLLDYVVFGIMLLISASIGIYYRFTGGKQRTAEEYLLADRGMSILPVAFSLMASFMSAITILGVSAENYSFGSQFAIINLGYGIFTPLAAYLYIPVFFNLQATSAYEYLERRFGLTSRLIASLAFSIQMIVYMGIVLYAPAIALEAVTGLPEVYAILSVGLVCTFYSTIGGLKAVLITDVFQSVLMFAAVFCVIISAWYEKGSLSEIFRIAQENGRLNLLNLNPDPTERHTLWSLIFGGGMTFLTLYAVNQAQVQRYLCVKDLATARKCLWWNWPLLSALSICTCFSGLCIFSKYADCDPLKSGRISTPDQSECHREVCFLASIRKLRNLAKLELKCALSLVVWGLLLLQLMPLYVMETVGRIPGLGGLFVAGIFSASLSTVSAAVNSLAAVTLEDYLKPAYRRTKGRELDGSTALPKIIAFVYGLVCVAMAFLAEHLGGVLQASLTIFGAVGGPLLGLFTTGMSLPAANEPGALTGLLASLAVCFWLGFGGPKPPLKRLPVSTEGCNTTTSFFPTAISTPLPAPDSSYFYLYRLSYLWVAVIGALTAWFIGIFASYVFIWTGYLKRTENELLDPNLFWPPIAKRLQKTSRSGARNGNYNVKALKPSAYKTSVGDSLSSSTRF